MPALSPKVKEKKATKWAEVLATHLLQGETIWAFVAASRFKPMTEATVITNARVIGFWTATTNPQKRLLLTAWADEIVAVDFPVKAGGTSMRVVTSTGEVNFGTIDQSDVDFATYYAEYLRGHGVDPTVAAARTVGPRLRQPDVIPAQPAVVTPARPVPVTPVPTSASSNLINDLERLADLHRQGLLTDVEFRTAKQAVIGQVSQGGNNFTPSDNVAPSDNRINLLKPE